MATMEKTREEWIVYADELAAGGDYETANKIRGNLGMEPLAPEAEPTLGDRLGQAKQWIDDKTMDFAQASVDVWPHVGQGMALGFGDELAALLESGLVPPGKQQERYRQARDRNRGILEQTGERSPMATGVADFAGGMISPANFVMPGAGPGASFARLAGREALEGGVQGALEAFGRSEGSGLQQAESAGTGAGLGALFQPALSGVMRLGAAAADPIMRLMRRTGQEPAEVAEEQVGRLLQQGAESPERVSQRLEEIGPTSMLADLDRQTAEYTAAARARSDEAGRIIDPALETRQQGQPDRVKGLLVEASGEKPSSAQLTELDLTDQLANYDQKNYAQIDELPIRPDTKMQQILDTPYVQTLMKQSRRLSQSRGRLSGDPLEPDASGFVPLEYYNDLKLLMDGRIKDLEDAVIDGSAEAAERAELSVLVELRKDFVEQLDLQTRSGDISKYAVVREGHARIAEQLDALKEGQKLNTMRENTLDNLYERMMGIQDRQVQTIYDELADVRGSLPSRLRRDAMPEEARVPFRRGATQAITREVDRPGGELADRAGRLLRGEDARRRLELMSETPEQAGRLQEQLAGEMQQYQTLQMVSPRTGSRTAVLEAAGERYDDEIGKMRDTAAVASGDPGAGFAATVNMLKREFANPEVAEEVAKLMVNPNITPQEIARLMQDRGVPETTRQRVMQFVNSPGARAFKQTASRQAAGALAQ